jgi:uncharacterized protein (TIGR00251 family)
VPAARRDRGDLLLELRIQPRASSSEFAGRFGDRVRVRLQAPPVDGRANEALVEFLARQLGVPRSSVAIEHGHGSRDKRVRVRGTDSLPAELRELFGLV